MTVPFSNIKIHLDTSTAFQRKDIERLIFGPEEITIDEAALAHSRQRFIEAMKSQKVYGINTGFGPHAIYEQEETDSVQNLLSHLSAGTGPAAEANIVRLTVLLRIITLSKGYSGVEPDFLKSLIEWYLSGWIALVPETGSVGASGDLIPLANILQAFRGKGHFIAKGKHQSPQFLRPGARDALAFVNGTAFSQAYLLQTIELYSRIIEHHLDLCACLIATLRANKEHFRADLNKAKGHPGQTKVAKILNQKIENTCHTVSKSDKLRPAFQEVYSIRCIAQVLGACVDQLDYATDICLQEINGIDDNPVLTDTAIVHGGNFFGQHLAFAADAMNAIIVQSAALAERQIALLLNPHRNGGWAGLSNNPGRDSGLSGIEINATALLAQMRSNNASHSTFSISTNAGNQDIVPMATLACQKAYAQIEPYSEMLAMLAACIHRHSRLSEAWSVQEQIKFPEDGSLLWRESIQNYKKQILKR